MTGSIALHEGPAADWLQALRDLARLTGAGAEHLRGLEQLPPASSPDTHLAIAGAPNTGKSSLINGLLSRRLLPVSTLPSKYTFTIASSEDGEAESYISGGVEHPLSQPPSALSPGAADNVIPVRLRDNWLAGRRLSLLETPALDAAGADLMEAVHRAVRGADIVLLLMDSSMAVRRAETVLLSECARRGLPVIVVLTKTDQLSAEEQSTLGDYVGRQVQAYAPGALVVETAVTSAASHGLDHLKQVIDDCLAAADFRAIRPRQTAEEFLHALEPIAAAAEAALTLQKSSAAERNEQKQRRRLATDEQATLWTGIENQLQLRRQQLEQRIRTELDTRRQSIADLLLHDLEGRSDVKVWWERELPFRLNRELRAAAEGLSGAANRHISADLHWLQEELARCFRLPRAAVSVEGHVALDGGDAPRKDLALWDTNRLKIVTRLGQAAALLVAGRLLLTTTLGGATLGLGILAGLAAEQAMIVVAQKDREKVRQQLDTVIQRATLEYSQDISRKLKAGYGEILEELRCQQQRWANAQDSAERMLQSSASAGETDWQPVVDQCRHLEEQIRGTAAAAAAART
ncbi:MAG: GTPase domain-containing protein [Paludibaculum sp.]